jgi:hypothetical protein
MIEPVYRVVWPMGRSAVKKGSLAPRLPDLRGKTVGELYNQLFKGDILFAELRRLLQGRFPGVRFVDYDVFGDTHGQHESAVVAALPEKLRSHGCDAVISAVGG